MQTRARSKPLHLCKSSDPKSTVLKSFKSLRIRNEMGNLTLKILGHKRQKISPPKLTVSFFERTRKRSQKKKHIKKESGTMEIPCLAMLFCSCSILTVAATLTCFNHFSLLKRDCKSSLVGIWVQCRSTASRPQTCQVHRHAKVTVSPPFPYHHHSSVSCLDKILSCTGIDP